jgi:hypothetical protein
MNRRITTRRSVGFALLGMLGIPLACNEAPMAPRATRHLSPSTTGPRHNAETIDNTGPVYLHTVPGYPTENIRVHVKLAGYSNNLDAPLDIPQLGSRDSIYVTNTRIRDGSQDYFIVEIYDWSPAFQQYFLQDTQNVIPEMNGLQINDAWTEGQNEYWFSYSLSWKPVSYHPTYIDITTDGLTLNSGDQSQSEFAYAVDANQQTIPGWPISWTSDDPNIVSISPDYGRLSANLPGYTKIHATIDGVSDYAWVYVNNALSISVTGQSTVIPNTTCTWVGQVTSTNAVSPYTYEWHRVDGTPSGDDPGPIVGTDEAYMASSGYDGSTFTLNLKAVDANGRQGWSGPMTINVSSTNGTDCSAQ